MFHECNPLITIYKTAFERLQDLDNAAEIQIILNPQMSLLLEKEADWCCNNLPNVDEVVIIISDKFNTASFCDIIFACQYSENNISIFQNISFTTAAYMPFYYILFFLYGDLGCYWAL